MRDTKEAMTGLPRGLDTGWAAVKEAVGGGPGGRRAAQAKASAKKTALKKARRELPRNQRPSPPRLRQPWLSNRLGRQALP